MSVLRRAAPGVPRRTSVVHVLLSRLTSYHAGPRASNKPQKLVSKRNEDSAQPTSALGRHWYSLMSSSDTAAGVCDGTAVWG